MGGLGSQRSNSSSAPALASALGCVRGDPPATAKGLSLARLSRLPRVAVSARSGGGDNLDGLGPSRPAGWSEDYMRGLSDMPPQPQRALERKFSCIILYYGLCFE